jgi:hypothetical protein
MGVHEAAVRRALDEIVGHVLPGHPLPLPTHWSGTVTTPAEETA